MPSPSHMNSKCLYICWETFNKPLRLLEYYTSMFSAFVEVLKCSIKFNCIHLNNHSNCPILYKPTKAIGDQSTCKGMKSRGKVTYTVCPQILPPVLTGEERPCCWPEPPESQRMKPTPRHRDETESPCAHAQCDNVRFEHVSGQVTSLTHRVSSVSSNSASIHKPQFSVGTVTQHLQWAGQKPVVQRGVPFTPSIRTLGQRAKDLECYRGIGTGYSGTERLVRKQGTKDVKFAALKKHQLNAAVIHQIK